MARRDCLTNYYKLISSDSSKIILQNDKKITVQWRIKSTEVNMTEQEITNESVKVLRKALGMGQAEFWGPIGVKQSASSGYESKTAIPKPVRILVVARYVCGIHIDADTDDGVAATAKLGAIQQKKIKAKAIAGEVKQDLAKAAKSIQTAHDALSSY